MCLCPQCLWLGLCPLHPLLPCSITHSSSVVPPRRPPCLRDMTMNIAMHIIVNIAVNISMSISRRIVAAVVVV